MNKFKKKYKQLLVLNQKTNDNFNSFIETYSNFFNKRQEYGYEEIIALDLVVYDLYAEFVNLLFEYGFKITKFKQPDMQAIIIDILESTKISPQEYYKLEEFDPLFYSYVLTELWIALPYVIEYFLVEYKSSIGKKINLNSLKIHSLSPLISYNCKNFERWDRLESRINNYTFDDNEKHPSSTLTYEQIHKKFSYLINNFILINTDLKTSKKMLLITKLKNNWYFIVIGLILIAIFIFLVVFYAINSK